MEIRPLGTALIQVYRRADRRKDRPLDEKNMAKELGAFRDYAKMRKNMLGDCKYSALSCLVTEERHINLCHSVVRHNFHLPYKRALEYLH
jgi:hypothetical protein